MMPRAENLKRLVLACALGVALVSGPSAAAARSWREQSVKVIDARGLEEVQVENARGLVTVRRSPDANLHLTALKIVRCDDDKRAMKNAAETQVVTAREGRRLTIRVRYPQRESVRVSFWDMFSGFEFPRVEVRIALEVPDGLSVRANSTSGDLSSEGLPGPQVLATTSGDVSVRSSPGVVQVSSTSGDITAADLGRARLQTVSGDLRIDGARGPLRATTTSGEISVEGAVDSLSLATVSGDVRVSEAPRGVSARTTSGDIVAHSAAGQVSLETSSGDVVVGLDAPLRRAEISTGSGDVEIALAPSLRCTLEMRTSNGTLDVSVPLQVKTVSRHLISGTVRSGAVPISVRSSSGDIDVKSGGD